MAEKKRIGQLGEELAAEALKNKGLLHHYQKLYLPPTAKSI